MALDGIEHSFECDFAFRTLVVSTTFKNQLLVSFPERARFFSYEVKPNRLFRVLRATVLRNTKSVSKITQIEITEPLVRVLGKCAEIQAKF